MIRINLLPIGRRPVEEKIRKEITVFFLLIFFSLSVMVYFHIDHTRTIKQITAEKKTVVVISSITILCGYYSPRITSRKAVCRWAVQCNLNAP